MFENKELKEKVAYLEAENERNVARIGTAIDIMWELRESVNRLVDLAEKTGYIWKPSETTTTDGGWVKVPAQNKPAKKC